MEWYGVTEGVGKFGILWMIRRISSSANFCFGWYAFVCFSLGGWGGVVFWSSPEPEQSIESLGRLSVACFGYFVVAGWVILGSVALLWGLFEVI